MSYGPCLVVSRSLVHQPLLGAGGAEQGQRSGIGRQRPMRLVPRRLVQVILNCGVQGAAARLVRLHGWSETWVTTGLGSGLGAGTGSWCPLPAR